MIVSRLGMLGVRRTEYKGHATQARRPRGAIPGRQRDARAGSPPWLAPAHHARHRRGPSGSGHPRGGTAVMTPGLATAAPSVPLCPDGHGAMVLRHGRTGEFFSCRTYPECRRTAPVLIDLPCPRCRAPLTVRSSRKTGKAFTGCSSYPACTYTVSMTPHTRARAVADLVSGWRASRVRWYRPRPTPAEAAMLTTCPSNLDATAVLRDELGGLEDLAASTLWEWDARISQRVDWLVAAIDRSRA
jgi:ssDNA-binding Zn-finger/Zn-ribbon topoisomerase 1